MAALASGGRLKWVPAKHGFADRGRGRRRPTAEAIRWRFYALDPRQRTHKYSHAIPHLKIPADGRILSVMQDSGPKLAHDRPEPDGARRSAQVLPFPPRGRTGPGAASHPPAAESSDDESEPFDDLAQYEQDREQQDESVNYPHRMLMNIIAVMVLTILIGAGVWLADTITYMERNQDCILQGRQNCAPIEISAPVRK